LNPLKQAVRLSPGEAYIKDLLALKLQDVGQETGETYVKEALTDTTSQTYIFQYAGKFYQKKGCTDKAPQLFERALQTTPSYVFLHYKVGLCYRQE
jgi:interferon-induced tetratricopeptide repeat-containing protein 1